MLLRRLLSIFLLAVLGCLFVSPLLAFVAESEAGVPVCCRRGGQHHCMMGAGGRSSHVQDAPGQDDSGQHAPGLQAPVSRCPYCPAFMAVLHGDTLLPPAKQALYGELRAHPAVAVQAECKFRISESRSRQKRGPPAHITL